MAAALMADIPDPDISTTTDSDVVLDFPELDEEALRKLVVVMVQGINIFGDRVYSYVQLTVAKFREMAEKIARRENFKPSDFGQVITAGRGEPPEELVEEMREKYNLVDVPNAQEAFDATNPAINMPSFMDDEK